MKRTILILLFGFSCTFLYSWYLKILEDAVFIDRFDISYETINLQIENVMTMGDRWQALGKSLSLFNHNITSDCLLYTSPSPRDLSTSRMPSSA